MNAELNALELITKDKICHTLLYLKIDDFPIGYFLQSVEMI